MTDRHPESPDVLVNRTARHGTALIKQFAV